MPLHLLQKVCVCWVNFEPLYSHFHSLPQMWHAHYTVHRTVLWAEYSPHKGFCEHKSVLKRPNVTCNHTRPPWDWVWSIKNGRRHRDVIHCVVNCCFEVLISLLLGLRLDILEVEVTTRGRSWGSSESGSEWEDEDVIPAHLHWLLSKLMVRVHICVPQHCTHDWLSTKEWQLELTDRQISSALPSCICLTKCFYGELFAPGFQTTAICQLIFKIFG